MTRTEKALAAAQQGLVRAAELRAAANRAIVAAYREGWSLRRIGAAVELPAMTVRNIVLASGTPMRDRGASKQQPVDVKRAAAMMRLGMSYSAIAVALHTSTRAVRDALAGRPRPPGTWRSASHVVLDRDRAAEMRRQGMSLGQIARALGVSRQCVHYALRQVQP